MKIGINALFFKYPASGTGQYMSHLIGALSEIDTRNEYVLLGPEPVTQDNAATAFPYKVQPVPGIALNNKNIEKVFWEQLTGPAAALKAGVDIFHVPYFAPPLLPRTTTVVTIHDVIPMRLPAYQPDGKVKAYMNLVSRASHNATLIITVSQHAKQDIVDALRIPAERIRVIYEAAGEEYQPVSDPERLARARARYGVGERYIFYLGGLDQRKNVPQLVRAFAHLHRQIGDPHLQLLIAGNPDKHKGPLFPDPRPVAAELGMDGQIIYRYIEEEDKPALYSGASIFVFPSLYEGFGLDPLEAMSCGAPVVCSNRTSLPEVVGDAAISVDPEDTRALVEAMRKVLSDSELQAALRTRSLERARQFSWQKTATETTAVYEEAFAHSKVRSRRKR
ncbi:glycosyltransferase family 1 protein [Ktedonosporobacter rubrisoli]|uniref:Glycosyltransferase family 1 protein n=1 Tax=Ktedonosporobacter rubrisoli TaxID=2509675 RepID=A0A4P6JUQ0_KTERU|nr:glycosyltransferase family 1 protein [Ktedonosporobacter rubrisoli]QBD79032.1 glycosyltransferase family 1 protein [Ktedonosporobacter rubrisoli]